MGEERRNALNLQKEENKKIKKDKEKEKKKKKSKKKQHSSCSSSGCNSPQPRGASPEEICDESKPVICDINRHNSPAALPTPDKHQQRLTQSPVSPWSNLTEKTCELSPTQSILSKRH